MLVDSVRHGACLACLWARGYIAYICIYILIRIIVASVRFLIIFILRPKIS